MSHIRTIGDLLFPSSAQSQFADDHDVPAVMERRDLPEPG
jgi:hypothetical protein